MENCCSAQSLHAGTTIAMKQVNAKTEEQITKKILLHIMSRTHHISNTANSANYNLLRFQVFASLAHPNDSNSKANNQP